MIPGGQWAIFTHTGSYDTLWITWRSVYRDWLPTSGQTPRDTAPYEVYLDDPKMTKPEQLRTQIYVPLQ